MSSEAKNLQVICEAMEQHNRNCPSPLVEIRLNRARQVVKRLERAGALA